MPVTVKLNKWEQMAAERQVMLLNKTLSQIDMKTLKESELIHKVLELCLTRAKVDDMGNIYIDLN